ncbi:MAG: hypothetical protein ACOCZT_03070 [Halanaerobiales bacterium]
MTHLENIGKKKWRITIELGTYPKTRKRKRKNKTINRTKKAQKIMLEMVNKYEKGNFERVKKYLSRNIS